MKVLYLCAKEFWDTKMSRCRFLSAEAIGKHPKMELIKDGKGFEGFSLAEESVEKHKPDVVMWYKPLEIPMLKRTWSQPTVLRYNEMYDRTWTHKEILMSGSNVVICHHKNDMPWYESEFKFEGVKFAHIPHSAEKHIFKDYGLPKSIDVALIGAIQDHYPLRKRMKKLIRWLPSKYKCVVHQHPGYNHPDAHTNRYMIDFARFISQCKICVTCSGKPRSRYTKYVEVPMCGTALAADLPGQDQNEIRPWLIHLKMEMSDKDIINKLVYFLENKHEREERVNLGLVWARQYTMGAYAERFYRAMKEVI